MILSRGEKDRLRDRLLEESRKRTLIMGILNVTPDSFSDGGRFDEAGAALSHAEAMVAEERDFFLSENGVWLTEFVEPRFLKLQENR
mgnify:CR=1 FL=1